MNKSKAINTFKELIEQTPDEILKYFIFGYKPEPEEMVTERIIELTARIIKMPTDIYAIYNRANAYFQLTKYELAIKDYTKTIAIQPKDWRSYNNRSVCHAMLGETDKAIADFTESVKLKNEETTKWGNCEDE